MDNINESFSSGGVMNVDDLRRFYHGRINLVGTFSSDGSPVMGTTMKRPPSILCHTVNDIIGKKATSNEFYLIVSRISPNKGLVDIGEYNEEMLIKDMKRIKLLGRVSDEVFDEIASRPKFRNVTKPAFQRFWEFSAAVGRAVGGSEHWGFILEDIGYWGFQDKQGRGIFNKQGVPCVLILDESFLDMLDIMPIQKFRKDPRKRVVSQVDRMNKRLSPARNRVAKAKRDPKKAGDDFLEKINKAKLWG